MYKGTTNVAFKNYYQLNQFEFLTTYNSYIAYLLRVYPNGHYRYNKDSRFTAEKLIKAVPCTALLYGLPVLLRPEIYSSIWSVQK